MLMCRSIVSRFSLLTLCFVLLGCETEAPPGSPASEAGSEEGRLVIIGGALLKSEATPVYQSILDGRLGEGPLCVFPPASETPPGSMAAFVAVFDALGGPGTAQGILLTVDDPQEADDQDVADRIKGCSGFFFTGGEQVRIVEVFLPEGRETLAYQAVWERFQAGAVVSGSSAGAAMMTNPMIAGGSSSDALRHGIRTEAEEEGVLLWPGMGYLDNALVDQHFLARGRWGRSLVALLGAEGNPLGFGIEENTALVIEGDSAWVVGASGVVFMDARDAVKEEGGVGGSGVRFFLLGSGDVLDLSTRAVTFEPSKDVLPEGDVPFDNFDADLFAPWNLLHLLLEAGTAPDTLFTFHQDGHFLEFRKEAGFQLRAWDGPGIQDTPLGLSVGPFVLSVWRE